MPAFKDTKGRLWDVNVTFAGMRRIADYTGSDLINDPAAFTSILFDAVKTVDAVYAVVRNQADSLGISDIDFGESLDGETFQRARKALIDSIVNFTPPDRREILKAGINQIMKMEAEGMKVMRDRMTPEALETEFDQAMKALIETLGAL